MNVYDIPIDKFKNSYERLSQHVRDAGYTTSISEKWSVFEYFSHILLHLTFLALAVLYQENSLLFFGFMFLSAFPGIGITTTAHTASHYSLVKSRRLNDFFVYFGYGLLFGASREYWMHKHVKVHHPNPNIVGIDEDIDLMPWFVMNRDDYDNASKLKKLYFRLQFLIIPFALTLNLFNVQKDGFIHLYRQIRKRGVTKNISIDLAIISCHFILWLAVPSLFFDFTDVLLFYYIRAAFIGYGMFSAFAPAHFPDNTLFLPLKEKEMDFVVRQLYTTTNFRAGIIGKFILGGVQYQIEHHLFPNCHHYHYPKINLLLKKFCQENHLPYNEMGWLKGIWESLKVFYKPKKVQELPVVLQAPREKVLV